MPPISHVVVLMMENNCFDRMLGGLAEQRPGLEGVDPRQPGSNPDGTSGQLVFQAPTTTRNIDRDPKHGPPMRGGGASTAAGSDAPARAGSPKTPARFG